MDSIVRVSVVEVGAVSAWISDHGVGIDDHKSSGMSAPKARMDADTERKAKESVGVGVGTISNSDVRVGVRKVFSRI